MKEAVYKKISQLSEIICSRIDDSTQNMYNSVSLFGGNTGLLLFLYNYTKISDNSKYRILADRLIDFILDSIENGAFTHTFSNGLSGVLYLFDLLEKQGFVNIDISESQGVLEDYMIKEARKDFYERNYDYLHGALGVGLYFLKKKSQMFFVDELVNILDNEAEKDIVRKTVKWKFSYGKNSNERVYNISMSHGMSSIIIFLSRTFQQNVMNPRIIPLLEGAINYVLEQEMDETTYGSYFPNLSLEEKDHVTFLWKSRLAWCYGDLGVAFSLWFAGKTTGNIFWQEKGLNVLLNSTRRRLDIENSVIDSGICHGTAGIAMIYRRMYLETANEIFSEASNYWINQTLNYSVFNDGLAGYKSYLNNEWVDDYSFLTGISGIGVVLISYLADDFQEWDELLLLSYKS